MPNAIISDGENMPEIQSLTVQVQQLSRSLDFWNSVMLWALGIGAIGALAVLITTRIIIVKGQRLATVQSALIRAKDAQLSETLQKGASDLETEKAARLGLEQGYAPRRLSEKQQQHLASKIKTFAGQTVTTFFHAGDHEGYVFCSEIASVLGKANWDVYAPASILDLAKVGRRGSTIIPTGVHVESTPDEKSTEAMKLLVRELRALGFDANGLADLENEPLPAVQVTVNDRPEGLQGEAKLNKEKTNKK